MNNTGRVCLIILGTLWLFGTQERDPPGRVACVIYWCGRRCYQYGRQTRHHPILLSHLNIPLFITLLLLLVKHCATFIYLSGLIKFLRVRSTYFYLGTNVMHRVEGEWCRGGAGLRCEIYSNEGLEVNSKLTFRNLTNVHF